MASDDWENKKKTTTNDCFLDWKHEGKFLNNISGEWTTTVKTKQKHTILHVCK